MYRIRFHGRGGQGMKTASRILGTAFFLEGFEVQDAPRYGAERRGAPIFAYVRADRAPIHERGIIEHPDLVVVADEGLLEIPAAGALSGLDDRAVLLIHTSGEAGAWGERLGFTGTIVALPVETAPKDVMRYIGARCAGAAARLVGVVAAASLEEAVRQELSSFRAAVVEDNVACARTAYDRVASARGCVKPGRDEHPAGHTRPDWIDLPFDEARISAPAIEATQTSVHVPTGLWRTARPVIDLSRCHRCTWICSGFCPDSAITPDERGLPRIDYEHCKGCMICVAQCPWHAIEEVPEQRSEGADG